MYSYQEVSGIEIAKAKGISRTTVKKDLRYELCKECIDNDKQFKHKQVYIRSNNHQMGVYEQNKTCLNSIDSKKWIAPNRIDTRAYGHQIKKDEMNDAINNMIVELYILGIKILFGCNSVSGGTTISSSRENPCCGPLVK